MRGTAAEVATHALADLVVVQGDMIGGHVRGHRADRIWTRKLAYPSAPRRLCAGRSTGGRARRSANFVRDSENGGDGGRVGSVGSPGLLDMDMIGTLLPKVRSREKDERKAGRPQPTQLVRAGQYLPGARAAASWWSSRAHPNAVLRPSHAG